MNEEIIKDSYDNNERMKLQKTLMIIMYDEITEYPYDNNERRNYKRPL